MLKPSPRLKSLPAAILTNNAKKAINQYIPLKSRFRLKKPHGLKNFRSQVLNDKVSYMQTTRSFLEKFVGTKKKDCHEYH